MPLSPAGSKELEIDGNTITNHYVVREFVDINDDGTVFGVSGPDDIVLPHTLAPGMLWKKAGEAWTVYDAPKCFYPEYPVPIGTWGVMAPPSSGVRGSIANDGTVNTLSYHYGVDPTRRNDWMIHDGNGLGFGMNEVRQISPNSDFNQTFPGAILDKDHALFVETVETGQGPKQYHMWLKEDSLQTDLSFMAGNFLELAEMSFSPNLRDDGQKRLWITTETPVFLEKRVGGTGAGRWHNPPSMGEGAIRLNARGEAIRCGDPATELPPKLWRNGKYTDLNDEKLTSKPTSVTITHAITHAIDLASNGIILAQATENGVTKTGLLLPANVAVDANRDGAITFDERDETTAQKPYEFWVNHDRDIGHTVDGNDWEEDDVQGNETSVTCDIFEPGLKWRRDLEDLTRVRIDLSVIETVLDTNDANIKLYARMEPSDGNPQVTLYQPVETDGDRKYLTDDDIGYNQTQSYYGDELCTAVNTPEGNEIPRRAWQILPSDKALHLLFEGKWQGKGKLIFEFRKNGQIFAKMPPVFLDLKKVEDMYETWTVGDVPYSGTQYGYWPAATALKTTGQNLPTPQTSQEKDYFLFVHGWNMSPFDKDVYAATAFKRLWHQGYKGRFGSFRWPTFFDLLSTDHFDGSEQRAWNSGVPLDGLVSQLSATFHESGQSKVRLYAHSMGNIVASECLRQSAQTPKVHTYISAQAAISSHVWDETTPLMPFPIGLGPDTPDVYGYYWQTGAQSRPHEWQEESRPSYMHSSYMPSSVFYINHYNPSDWALSFGLGWQDNQMLKPNVGYHYSIINPFDLTDLNKRFWKDQATKLNFPDDRFEIFSFAAESHSYATGQQGSTGGMFGAAVNLNDTPFSFGGAHKGHSAQFRSTIQKRWTYWARVLNDMLITTP